MNAVRQLSLAFLMLAGWTSVASAQFEIVPWINDSTLDFIDGANLTYTHAVDIANTGGAQDTVTAPGALVINGLTFDSANADGGFNDPPDAGGHTWTGSDFVLDIQIQEGDGGVNPFSWGDGSAAANGGSNITGTNSTELSTGIVAGGSTEITLSGLSTNTDYSFVWFSPTWNQGGGPRTGVIEASFDDFVNVVVSPTINQDADGDPNPAAINQIVAYQYNTGSNTSISFRTASDTGDTLHSYGFLNQVGMVELPELIEGDADRNGVVDINDFNLISDEFLTATVTPGFGGDVNFDSFVDQADFRIWKNAFADPGSTVGLSTVPEPKSLVVCLLAAIGMLTMGPSRRHLSDQP